MTGEIVDRLRTLVPDAATSPIAVDQYQSLVEAISGGFGHEAVDTVIRQAVLDACGPTTTAHRELLERARHARGREQLAACVELQQATDIWSLSPAAEAIGGLVNLMRQRLTPEDWRRLRPGFVTTNFDGLIEVAVERAGLRPRIVEVVDDRRLQAPHLGDDDVEIWHLHGYWCGTTMHTREQLRAERSELGESLRHLLEGSIVVVLGYGGWQDAFTRALGEVVDSYKLAPTLLWTFYEKEQKAIEAQSEWILGQLEPGKISNRVHYYTGVDVHTVLPSIQRKLIARSRDEALRPLRETVIPGWIEQLLRAWDPTTGGFRVYGDDPDSMVQSWSTSQCLCALLLQPREMLEAAVKNVGWPQPASPLDQLGKAVDYLEATGWGLSAGKSPATAIGAWMLLAEILYLRAVVTWAPDPVREHVVRDRVTKRFTAVLAQQQENGGFIEFGSQLDKNTRTYSTALVLWAVAEALHDGVCADDSPLRHTAQRAVHWLLEAHRDQGGWVPNPNRDYKADEQFVGLTAHVLFALMKLGGLGLIERAAHIELLMAWLDEKPLLTRTIHMNDRLSDRDQHVAGSSELLEGSMYLWFPWSLAVLSAAAQAGLLPENARLKASSLRDSLIVKVHEERHEEIGQNGVYEIAEYLAGFAHYLRDAGGE